MPDNIIDNLFYKVFSQGRQQLSAAYVTIHKYLGIIIDWAKQGKVMFTMYDFLEGIIETVL